MPSSHGGSIALSGYIFQLLAVTGIQVSAGPNEKKGSEKEEAFLVFHEWLEEDGTVADPITRSVTFVQVKYSENAKAAKISTAELKTIVKRFAAATKLANKKRWDVSGYILMSNRDLSDPARQLLDFSVLTAKTHRRRGGKAKAKHKTGASWRGDQKNVATCLVDVLVSTEEVKAVLKAFAARYGVLDHEFDTAVRQLMATIFTEVADLRDSGVTTQEWVQMLTGSRDAVSLERGEQEHNQYLELDKITAHDREPHEHLPREKVDNLFDLNPQYSCFVFYGKGGMGKTASLRYVANREADRKLGPLIKGELAIDAEDHWATGCAETWRNTSVAANGTIERVIERLKRANPKTKGPVLVVALDGIDETFHPSAAKDLRALLSILKKNFDPRQPVSTSNFKLIVTCRNLSELKQYLPHDAADVDEQPLDWIKSVPFDPFNAEEFRDIVLQDAKNLADRLAPETSISALPRLNAVTGNSRDEQTLTSSRYTYLRDPLTWREFISLTPAQQSDVLDQKDDATFALGEKLFERFARKANRRRPTLDRDTLIAMMKAVAAGMEGLPGPWTRNAWCEKGKATGVSTENQCIMIFGEASEAGLIDGSAADWNWRNFAIPHFLKNAPV